MNKLFYTIILISVVLSACNNDKKQEKDLQKQVVDFHEKVMADDEQAMIKKMKLDTVIMQANLAKADTAAMHRLSAQLMAADDAMGEWMKKFEPDYTGKSHEDIIKYLTDQQVKVKQVDSMLISATKDAAAYLQNIKKK
jgi:antirestriction protein